ncbi:MAG: hypothetical protein GC179_21085 [Anaerolineaceae bacterium]|nr:hypothetical protein [Anaerolineaceae bacterium]
MFQFWLALDCGTTGVKAALMDTSGKTLRSAYRAYPTHVEEGGISEQDANHWWQASVEAISELRAIEAQAIALTGQMQDVILLDAAGRITRSVILYSDTRAHEEANEINRKIGIDRLRQLTGNNQGADSLLAKLLWLTRHEPETLDKSDKLLIGAADYLAYKMTGQSVTDTTTASTTGLFNIQTRQALAQDVLTEMGLAHINRLFPVIQTGGTKAGSLRAEVSRELGLKDNIPVFHGPGDAGATTLGAGSGEIGRPYAYIGTSGWVAFTASQQAGAQTGVFTLAHPSPEHYICIAPILTAGGNLEWLRGLFGEADVGQMIRAALNTSPGKLLYLPYLNGERSPFSDPFARGTFIGLQVFHRREEVCRAVLEGIAFAYRHILDTLVTDRIDRLTLTGGGTRSAEWCQLIATIIGVPIAISSDADHASARGAILAAQVASGEREQHNYSISAEQEEIFEPQAKLRQHYDAQYTWFKAAYPALKPIFEGLETST